LIKSSFREHPGSQNSPSCLYLQTISHRWYIFMRSIPTQQPIPVFRDRKLVCRVVLIGTFLATLVVALLLLVSLSLNHAQAGGRLAVCGVAFLYIIIAQLLARAKHYRAVSYLLVIFYTVLATGIVWSWGINTPIGLLTFGLVIVLAGVVLTARHAIFIALATMAILTIIQATISLGWHTPDITGTGSPSSFGDVFAYCTVFDMLALISWLYNREIERLLDHAGRAEMALRKQKSTLKTQVKKRTAELRQLQLEEMQHMYHFAELGQLGVTLLHDLAGHLTALTLEIEGIQSKAHAKTIERAQQIIQYLGDIVTNTRNRLQGESQEQTFNIVRKISEVVDYLRYKAGEAQVVIDWQPTSRSWEYTGDPHSLCQVVAIIANNAIDAYPPAGNPLSNPKNRRVTIALRQEGDHLALHISDYGKGISKSERKRLFKPTHSTKKSGLGLGLYIAKQITEMEFSGTISLNPSNSNTEFIISLPLTRHG